MCGEVPPMKSWQGRRGPLGKVREDSSRKRGGLPVGTRQPQEQGESIHPVGQQGLSRC